MLEYFSFIAFVPKAALAALLVIGGFIAYEIANIFNIPSRLKSRKEKNKVKKELKPVKFPKNGVPFEVETKKDVNARRRMILTILAILTIITGIVATIIAISQNQNIQKQASAPMSTFSPGKPSPTSTPIPTLPLASPAVATKSAVIPALENSESTDSAETEESAQIKIYKIVNSEWIEIQGEDLKLLSSGSKVYIAAFSLKNYQKAVFKSNGKIIEPDPSTQINLFGELYVEYTLPPGKKEFKLEVEFLKS